MQQSTFKSRNPVVVLLWTCGLLILMQVHQYVGIFLSSLICGAGFEAIIEGEFNNECVVLCNGLAALIIGIPVVILIARYLWRRSWKWLRFRFNGTFFSFGLILGILLPSIVLVFLIAIDMAAIVATPSRYTFVDLLSIILGTTGFMLFVAISEELVFRGMVFREWAVRMNVVLAIFLSGLYFAAVHILSLLPRISFFQGAWIMVSAVVVSTLFVAMYLRSKSLWLPIGFHFGWNLCLQLFFGTMVSGQEVTFGLFRTELSGPAILTGGVFGIESSVLTYILYIVAAVLLLKYSRSGRPELLNLKPYNKIPDSQENSSVP